MAASSQGAADAMSRIRLIELVNSGMRRAWGVEWRWVAMSDVGGWVVEGGKMAGCIPRWSSSMLAYLVAFGEGGGAGKLKSRWGC